ncbi:olfactory receptor 6N1-like [Hoplias malabaricus]|uniref:olfactory receptor 6N1-like n=1 Tax=Hoplias malabaricus TaxID=27720 RepID=UPI00346249BE
MSSSSNVTYLILDGFVELETYRYLYFVITLVVYLGIICCNCVVIFVICTNKCLHEPMYIFITALLLNSLLGTLAFYPKFLIDLLSEKQVVSLESCLFQSYCIYTYATSEFTLLTAMAYDRYVSICKPLQYSTLVNITTVKKLLFFCWFVPSCENCVTLILPSQVYVLHNKLCKFRLNRIYCSNSTVVKLSCGDTSVRNSYGMFVFSVAVFPPMFIIIFTYIRIITECLKNSKNFRRKALQTCFPHLFIFITFTVTSCFEVINSRFEGNVPHIFSIIMSVENLVISPLINPIIYGLKMQEIWSRIKQMVWKKKSVLSF